MGEANRPYVEWLGRREIREEFISLAPALGVNAVLDIEDRSLADGDPLPAGPTTARAA